MQLVAPSITCATTLSQVLSPSGCTSTSAHPTVDEFNMKTSPMANHIYYNYGNRSLSGSILGHDVLGRRVQNCVGVSPPDALEQGTLAVLLQKNGA